MRQGEKENEDRSREQKALSMPLQLPPDMEPMLPSLPVPEQAEKYEREIERERENV
jgi:hypothetical protein